MSEEEVRHPCAFRVIKIVAQCTNLYGSVGVECKNNDVKAHACWTSSAVSAPVVELCQWNAVVCKLLCVVVIVTFMSSISGKRCVYRVVSPGMLGNDTTLLQERSQAPRLGLSM